MSNLSELLEATDVPDWQVAAECGIHPSALSCYQRGTRVPHERHAAYLADYFDVTIEVILGQAEVDWPALRARAAQSAGTSSSG